MNDELKKIIGGISKRADVGRWSLNEAEDPLATGEEEEDPLAAGGEEEDPLGMGGEDPMAGGEDPMAMGGEMGEEDPEAAKDAAEAAKAEAEAEAAEAEADAAKAEAEQEKSEAEREKAEAEAGEYNGIQIFSRPGVAFLVGMSLDDAIQNNTIDTLAQQYVSKLQMDDKGFQKFKAESGPLLKLNGFQQLINSMEGILKTSTDSEVDDATQNS